MAFPSYVQHSELRALDLLLRLPSVSCSYEIGFRVCAWSPISLITEHCSWRASGNESRPNILRQGRRIAKILFWSGIIAHAHIGKTHRAYAICPYNTCAFGRGGMTGVNACRAGCLVSRSSRPFPHAVNGAGEGETARGKRNRFCLYQSAPSRPYENVGANRAYRIRPYDNVGCKGHLNCGLV